LNTLPLFSFIRISDLEELFGHHHQGFHYQKQQPI